MKAIVCERLGPPESALVLLDRPYPMAGPGQVVVAIRAAGVNYPDALVIQGKHQYKPTLPFSLGAELAGVVREIGPGVKGFQLGQAVYGMRLRGSFAEAMAVDATCLQPKPPELSWAAAAALPVAYNTAYYALVTLARLGAGETALVLGASGGVGYAAVQIARALGARVIAAASSPEKLAISKEAGADDLIDYATENLRERLRALTGAQGVNVVFDPVGGAYAEPALRGMAWGGRYLVIGFASGEIPRPPLNLVLLKNASVMGVFLGEACSRDAGLAREIDLGVNKLARAGLIHPRISARYRLDQVPEALRALLERKVSGKVVVLP